MNEPIFELIQSQNEFRGLLWTEEDKQEFAELIVRECAAYIVPLDAEPVTHKSAARMLMDHFGVK